MAQLKWTDTETGNHCVMELPPEFSIVPEPVNIEHALANELSSAKAAFRDLTDQIYQREAAYRAVIDGIEDWLQEHSTFSPTATMALTELRRVKFSALSGLRSLPPRDLDSPSTSPEAPPA